MAHELTLLGNFGWSLPEFSSFFFWTRPFFILQWTLKLWRYRWMKWTTRIWDFFHEGRGVIKFGGQGAFRLQPMTLDGRTLNMCRVWGKSASGTQALGPFPSLTPAQWSVLCACLWIPQPHIWPPSTPPSAILCAPRSGPNSFPKEKFSETMGPKIRVHGYSWLSVGPGPQYMCPNHTHLIESKEENVPGQQQVSLSHLQLSSKMWSCWVSPGYTGLWLWILIGNFQMITE